MHYYGYIYILLPDDVDVQVSKGEYIDGSEYISAEMHFELFILHPDVSASLEDRA